MTASAKRCGHYQLPARHIPITFTNSDRITVRQLQLRAGPGFICTRGYSAAVWDRPGTGRP
jgi:hypothetical protein